MGVTIDINGIPVDFPFKPYDIQKDYMKKVIECIQNETTAVLESPTGTGKTLSLLCSSLAWLQLKKAQIQAQRFANVKSSFSKGTGNAKGAAALSNFLDVDEKALAQDQDFSNLTISRSFVYSMPRTHSQLTQAVQELKRTAYNHMNCSVLGSREQLCIHPEVLAEQDRAAKLHMCRMKVSTKSCHYNNKVDRMKDDPEICNTPILDIEDMVKLENKRTFCPYYMTKERKQNADIIFTPYNYLLDPLSNAVIILDEGHNVEKVCEESASIDVKSSDIALAIDETTNIMKMVSETPALFDELPSSGATMDPEQLANLKMMLIEFEKALDEVSLTKSAGDEIAHFPGDFIFELLEKAQITLANFQPISGLIDSMIQYLTAQNDGPFARKDKGLQLFMDFLTVTVQRSSESLLATKDKIKHCYKVYVREDESNEKAGKQKLNTWLSKGSISGRGRILSFWCFSPGFGMDFIVSQGIKCLILTSGTLAPLKPLISELELNVTISLENPHIVTEDQICVKVLTKGPDGESLNSSFRNRDNPKYVSSLGRAIVNLTRIIPSGLLIFFPSYPIMQKCQTAWEAEGIWSSILAQKTIFVEPKGKEAFSAAMTGYYEKVQDPNLKGAIFMAVCRGKVSEGLDFADANGRAVIITGLPYPPLKDPRVILKRRYLDACHAQDKDYLTGQTWYSLEASRAVNQAIGRVIRHRHDYGAILLLDERFNGLQVRNQMSMWLRNHIKVVNKYGEVIRDLSQFFRKAQNELPAPVSKALLPSAAAFELPKSYSKKGFFDFPGGSSTSTDSLSSQSSLSSGTEDLIQKYLGSSDNPNGTVTIHSTKRDNCEVLTNKNKRKKINLTYRPHYLDAMERTDAQPDHMSEISEYVLMVKSKLGPNFATFAEHLRQYHTTTNIAAFIASVDPLIPHNLRYILSGLDPFLKNPQQSEYRNFLRRNNLVIPEDL
ncbi:hypothetical protein YQE_03016, partial [Dendroctonus ponderosae]